MSQASDLVDIFRGVLELREELATVKAERDELRRTLDRVLKEALAREPAITMRDCP